VLTVAVLPDLRGLSTLVPSLRRDLREERLSAAEASDALAVLVGLIEEMSEEVEGVEALMRRRHVQQEV
jgi:hypothetical protein